MSGKLTEITELLTEPLTELIKLWERLIGTAPSPQQFEIWLAQFDFEITKQGILKTAMKNMSLDGLMTAEHRVRFASKCMIVQGREMSNTPPTVRL